MSEVYTTGTGQQMYTHERGECNSGHCPIHNPSKHVLRDCPTNWRQDKGIMERICPHGIGHPDPDCMYAQQDTTHGCDGCCGGKR